MKRIIILLSLIVLTTHVWSKQSKQEVLTASKSLGQVVLQGKKSYTYYALSNQVKTEFAVEGPGELKINVRVRAEKGKFKSEPFKLRYLRSNKFLQVEQVPQLLAGNLKFKSKSINGTPTKAHTLVISVPPGKHKYSFFKYKTEQKVHLRAFYTAHEKPKWVSITPSGLPNERTISYIKTGKKRIYSRVTRSESLRFEASHATDLRLIVRPEFTYKMLDEAVVKLKLLNETTGEARIYKVSARRSSKVEYRKQSKYTPGRSSTFYVTLEEPVFGSETYSLSVVNGAKAALVKVSTNKSAVLQ